MVDQNRNQIELGISGSFYMDYRNGTKSMLLPPDLGEFEIVVDGGHMEEMSEPYRVDCTLILDGELADHRVLDNSISQNTRHTTSVTLQEAELIMGQTSVQVVGENPFPVVVALVLAAMVAGLHLPTRTSSSHSSPSALLCHLQHLPDP